MTAGREQDALLADAEQAILDGLYAEALHTIRAARALPEPPAGREQDAREATHLAGGATCRAAQTSQGVGGPAARTESTASHPAAPTRDTETETRP